MSRTIVHTKLDNMPDFVFNQQNWNMALRHINKRGCVTVYYETKKRAERRFVKRQLEAPVEVNFDDDTFALPTNGRFPSRSDIYWM